MSNITLRKHLEAYESTPGAWKQDHEEAMLCFDVQDSIEFGLKIVKMITELDESVRIRGFQKKLDSDKFAELCRDVESLYHKWLVASLAHQQVIADLHHKGFTIEGAEEFRKCVDEVQKMLTPDREFFAGAGMIAMRDDAIDSHARGEAEEWSPCN